MSGAFTSDATDADLVDLARRGDRAAIVDLWTRHFPAVLSTARGYARQPRDAEELASDAFTSMLSALASGGGPTGSVRAYLTTSVRNAAASRSRKASASEVLTDDRSVLDRPSEGPSDPVAHAGELGLVREAFASLPRRWQLVLWRSAVDHDSNIAIAQDLGMSPNAVASLSRRAKDGLREAYLRVHLSVVPLDPECREFVYDLARYAILPAKVPQAVREHVADCAKCSDRVAELRSVDGRMPAILAPAVLTLIPSATLSSPVAKGVAKTVTAHSHRGLKAAVAVTVTAVVGAVWWLSPTDSPRAADAAGRPTETSTVGSVLSSESSSQAPSTDSSASPSSTLTVPSTTGAGSSSTGSSVPGSTSTTTTTTPPSSTDTATPASPAPMQLTMTMEGKPRGPLIGATLTASGTVGDVRLSLTVPTGVALDSSSGDWDTCHQSGDVITCTAAHQVDGTWVGQVQTVWSPGITGTATAVATGTYQDGSAASVDTATTWPPANGSSNEDPG
jgi:RNA polymerase sigma factor (sigma-70 family)